MRGSTALFVEELSKGAGLLLLIALGSRAVAIAFDGFILGAFGSASRSPRLVRLP